MPNKPTSPHDANLKAALTLAAAGFFVFPAKPDKSPFEKGWQKGSRDEAKIREWWQKHQAAIPALPCGVNGLLVVDCDVKNDIDGNANWDAKCSLNGLDHSICVVLDTPSGGRHFYFRQTSYEPLRNSAGKIADAIDTRGDGGYVIAPGAVLPDGRAYTLTQGSLAEIPQLPNDLDSFLRTNQVSSKPATNAPKKPTDYAVERAYAVKALESEAAMIAKAPAGERNNTLNKAAFKIAGLLENGGISRGEAEQVLGDAAQAAGLGTNEVSSTLASAFDAGRANPREPISTRNEQLQQGVDLSAFQAKIQSSDTEGSAAPGLVPIRISDVKPEAVEWLWPNRIAIGKLTIIAGDPGLGKSQLTAFVAACVTTGRAFPNETENTTMGDVIMFSCEDDVADTIRPRLEATGADLTRICAIEEYRERDGRPTPVNLVEHIAEIEKLLTANTQVRLVVVDPISAYLGKVDSHKNSDVRAALAPLQTMAQKHRVAVVAISHFNKSGGNGKATNAVTGSGAFVAASRATFIVTKGQASDEGLRLFVEAKNNLGRAKALAFRIESRTVCDGIEAPCIVFEDGEVDVNADQLLGAKSDDNNQSKRDEAVHFLRIELESGSVPTLEIKARARNAGIADKTLIRAKEKLGVQSAKEGYQGQWVWRLPYDPQAIISSELTSKEAKQTKDSRVENEGAFDERWPSLDVQVPKDSQDDR